MAGLLASMTALAITTRYLGSDGWGPYAGTCLASAAGATAVIWVFAGRAYALTAGEFFEHLAPLVLALAFALFPFLVLVETNPYPGNAIDALRPDVRAAVVALLGP